MTGYLLSKGFRINEHFWVELPVLRKLEIEYYRVTDSHNNKFFLKLARAQDPLLRKSIEDENRALNNIKHPNIINYVSGGEVAFEGKSYTYGLLSYVKGVTVSKKMELERIFLDEIINIVVGVGNGLNYLHSLNEPIYHNNINPDTILIDLSRKVHIPIISNFSNITYGTYQNNYKQNDSPFFQADEMFLGQYSAYSDQFSLGALFYYLLERKLPWFINNTSDTNILLSKRAEPLVFDSCFKAIHTIIRKALNPNPAARYASIKDFIFAIYESNLNTKDNFLDISKKSECYNVDVCKDLKGFNAIAGMEDLKKVIKVDIIDAISNKEQYKKYGLTIPNGMLFYGPPGCGKTFFTEKMAEELGFTFFQIKPSDIQSKWINASQENIKNLFDEARNRSPSIVFLDELDAIAPNRDESSVSHMNSSVVNEILTQLNNCGDDDVFVVGATNRYEAIDKALLRKGRLDKHVYIPPPDFKAREEMFKLYLIHRPIEEDIDCKELSRLTEGRVSSDVKFLCDEAARMALQNNEKIKQIHLLKAISEIAL